MILNVGEWGPSELQESAPLFREDKVLSERTINSRNESSCIGRFVRRVITRVITMQRTYAREIS